MYKYIWYAICMPPCVFPTQSQVSFHPKDILVATKFGQLWEKLL